MSWNRTSSLPQVRDKMAYRGLSLSMNSFNSKDLALSSRIVHRNSNGGQNGCFACACLVSLKSDTLKTGVEADLSKMGPCTKIATIKFGNELCQAITRPSLNMQRMLSFSVAYGGSRASSPAGRRGLFWRSTATSPLIRHQSIDSHL